jgi:hypothetical protein
MKQSSKYRLEFIKAKKKVSKLTKTIEQTGP